MRNAVGRDIPTTIPGWRDTIIPFQGEWNRIQEYQDTQHLKTPAPYKIHTKDRPKLCNTLDQCLKQLHLHDGMTISFHHHLRGGDEIVVPVVRALANLGFRDIRLASSSLTSAHEDLLPFLQDGTITQIWTSGLRGSLGKAVSEGILDIPVTFHSHGGRARAIEEGTITIDVAFIAASAADNQGNATGSVGPSAFGSLGYPMVDANYAKQVVVLTDNLVPYPCIPASIKQDTVDAVVTIDRIGDPSKIAGDTTRITTNELDLTIAQLAAKAIVACEAIQPGFSFQVGAGGASLAVARYVRDYMLEKKLTGSFLLGGVTSVLTDMLAEGLFASIFDVQSFDAAVQHSILDNQRHVEISASQYANPFSCGCMTHMLNVVVLAALEVDVNFNANVMVGSDGYIRGASGGHSDTAAGADLTVLTVPSIRKGTMPIIRDTVTSIVTPGSSIDLVVTENCICVNPQRPDLATLLQKTNLPLRDIHDVAQDVATQCPPQTEPRYHDKIVGVIEYRDGSIIDVIRQIAP